MVAVLIFALGGGFSIYEGIDSFENPEMGGNALISYVVLGIAALFEGTAPGYLDSSIQQDLPPQRGHQPVAGHSR